MVGASRRPRPTGVYLPTPPPLGEVPQCAHWGGRGPAAGGPFSLAFRLDSSPKGGAKGRAHTQVRPYKNPGPFLPVGADLCGCSGPLVKGRFPLSGGNVERSETKGVGRLPAKPGGGFRRPEISRMLPPHPALRATFPPGGRSGAPSRRAPRRRSFPKNSQFSIPNSFIVASSIFVRFRLTAKARSFHCSDSPHRTRGCRRWTSAGAP